MDFIKLKEDSIVFGYFEQQIKLNFRGFFLGKIKLLSVCFHGDEGAGQAVQKCGSL